VFAGKSKNAIAPKSCHQWPESLENADFTPPAASSCLEAQRNPDKVKVPVQARPKNVIMFLAKIL
jgi:hypothetical protein